MWQRVAQFAPWRAPGSAPVIDSCGVAGGVHKGEGPAVRPTDPLVSACLKGTRVLISLWDSLMFGRVPGTGKGAVRLPNILALTCRW